MKFTRISLLSCCGITLLILIFTGMITNISARQNPEEAIGTTIEEQVLLDAIDIKITAKEFVTDDFWGDGIKLLIENNSSNTVGIGLEQIAVNNYMISDLFSEKVAAGKKAFETLYFSESDLEEAGIDQIEQIEVYFYIYDSESYSRLFTAKPAVIKTNNFTGEDIEPNDEGLELYNDNGIRIVFKYLQSDDIFGESLVLFLENKTDQDVNIQDKDLSINGFMVSSLFSSTILAGKMAIDEIMLLDSDLEENDIESIEEVELKFTISNRETYQTITETDSILFSVD